jgi:CheY-like chemotaxis protein
MKHKQSILILSIVLIVTTCSGCLWAPELDGIRKDIERQLPGASFHREFALSVGPITLGLARTIVRLVPDAAEAREYLEDVRSVKVAIYDASNLPIDADLTMPKKLASLIEEDGWEVAARVNQDNENVWLLYRAEEDSIKDIYVVVLSDDELVLIRAHGNIDHLAAKAMRDHVADASPVRVPGI